MLVWGAVSATSITLPVQAITLNWATVGDVNLVDSATFQLSTDGNLDDDSELSVTSGTFNYSGTPAQDNSFGDLETFLGLSSGALDIGGEAFEGSVLSTVADVSAGDTLSFDWQFLTNETASGLSRSLNDYAFIAINDQVTVLADIGDATVNSSFFDQETGIQTYSSQFSQTGSVSLALGVLDIDDFIITSGLSVENLTITPAPNPTSTPESGNILGLLTILGLSFLGVKKKL